MTTANILNFRLPEHVIPVPTPSAQHQKLAPGVPDNRLTREAAGLLYEFSTPLLINHSHRVFFWADELGRQTGRPYDAELLFVCVAFHDLGLLKTFRSEGDRFESIAPMLCGSSWSITGFRRPASRQPWTRSRYTRRRGSRRISRSRWSCCTTASAWMCWA
jgi:hypothetical protein